MRVIVTGSREWADWHVVFRALTRTLIKYGPFKLGHGACATGADWYAHQWYQSCGRELGCTERRYPADWGRLGRGAGPERNRRMIADGADLVLAFPLPRGSGTQHTMRLAEAAGIPVELGWREACAWCDEMIIDAGGLHWPVRVHSKCEQWAQLEATPEERRAYMTKVNLHG